MVRDRYILMIPLRNTGIITINRIRDARHEPGAAFSTVPSLTLFPLHAGVAQPSWSGVHRRTCMILRSFRQSRSHWYVFPTCTRIHAPVAEFVNDFREEVSSCSAGSQRIRPFRVNSGSAHGMAHGGSSASRQTLLQNSGRTACCYQGETR